MPYLISFNFNQIIKKSEPLELDFERVSLSSEYNLNETSDTIKSQIKSKINEDLELFTYLSVYYIFFSDNLLKITLQNEKQYLFERNLEYPVLTCSTPFSL